jgi:CRISPR-associated protein Cas2
MYLFAYDITDNKRRIAISKELEKFGVRKQKSFFQCDISEDKAEMVKEILLNLMDKKSDSLIFYPICSDCLEKAVLLGKGSLLEELQFEIL